MHSAIVITEAGRVVGVQVELPVGSRHVGPVATLRAGPSQQLHRIDVELPEALATADEVGRFHAGIEKQLTGLGVKTKTKTKTKSKTRK